MFNALNRACPSLFKPWRVLHETGTMGNWLPAYVSSVLRFALLLFRSVLFATMTAGLYTVLSNIASSTSSSVASP